MAGKNFELLIIFIVSLFVAGVILIFGLFGFWRRHNKQNSARAAERDAKKLAEQKPDPWEAAGKRLNVKADDENTLQ